MNIKIATIKNIFVLLISFFLSDFCTAETSEKPYNYVHDYSNILTNQEERVLNEKFKLFEEKVSKKIYVLVISSEEAETDSSCTEFIQKWKAGQPEKDNTILMTFFYKKRKLRIDAGSNLQSEVTDNFIADIISFKMTPLIKEGEFYQAIASGADALIQASLGKYKPVKDVEASQRDFLKITSSLAFIFCIVLFFMYSFKYVKLKKSETKHLNELKSFHRKWIPATTIMFGIFFLAVLNYFTLGFFGKNVGFLIAMFLFFILIPLFGINLIALIRKDGLNFDSFEGPNFGGSLSRGWI